MRMKAAVLAVVLVALAALWWLLQVLGMPNSLSTQALSGWLEGQGMAGPALLMLLMIIAVVVGPIPTLPISATAGMVYGLVAGTAIAASGALVGAVIAFTLARLLGRDWVRRRFPDNPVLAQDGSQRLLTLTVFLTRLIPVFSFALISYAAGVTAIHVWRFALATLVGMLPMTVVFAGLGHNFALHPVLTVLAGLAVLAAMVSLPWYVRLHPDARLSRWLWRRRGTAPDRRRK